VVSEHGHDGANRRPGSASRAVRGGRRESHRQREGPQADQPAGPLALAGLGNGLVIAQRIGAAVGIAVIGAVPALLIRPT
jgi:hypothetical protein